MVASLCLALYKFTPAFQDPKSSPSLSGRREVYDLEAVSGNEVTTQGVHRAGGQSAAVIRHSHFTTSARCFKLWGL